MVWCAYEKVEGGVYGIIQAASRGRQWLGGLMIMENMEMAFLAIRANKKRSVPTMLGIIIGIGSVISIVSIGDTMRKLFSDIYKDVGITQAYVYEPGACLHRQDEEKGAEGLFYPDGSGADEGCGFHDGQSVSGSRRDCGYFAVGRGNRDTEGSWGQDQRYPDSVFDGIGGAFGAGRSGRGGYKACGGGAGGVVFCTGGDFLRALSCF